MSTRYICPHCREEQDTFSIEGDYNEWGRFNAYINAGEEPYDYDVDETNSRDTEYSEESWHCPDCGHNLGRDFVDEVRDSDDEVYGAEEEEEEEEEIVTYEPSDASTIAPVVSTGIEGAERARNAVEEHLRQTSVNAPDYNRYNMTCPHCKQPQHIAISEVEHYCLYCSNKIM